MPTETTKPLPPATASEHFVKFRPLAHKLAARYAEKFNLPLADVQEEAESQLGLLLSGPKNPGYSDMTRIYRNICWRLTEFATRRQPKYKTFSGCPREAVAAVSRAAVKPSWWETLLADLGEDARVLATTLLNAPAELAEDLTPRRAYPKGKPAAAAYLARQGWSGARFEAAWWEVAGAL